jgi:hypothetical protein
VRPRFIALNAVLAALLTAAWWAGLLAAFASVAPLEIAMLALLAAYFLSGLVSAWQGCWAAVRHTANGLPMLALVFTGLGLVLAVSGPELAGALSPEAMVKVFRNLALAILPNVVGVFLMAWLREIAFWLEGKEI